MILHKRRTLADSVREHTVSRDIMAHKRRLSELVWRLDQRDREAARMAANVISRETVWVVGLPPYTLAKRPDEGRQYAFDFTQLLASGETITGTPTLTVNRVDWQTNDLTTGSVTSSGSRALFNISAGSDGVTYRIICKGVTSAGNTVEGQGFLLVSGDA